jgi:3D (Asp-Asp-Asp) domain-containing protein
VPRAAALALALCLWAAPSVQAQTPTSWADTSAYCCVGAGGGYCARTASGEYVRPGAIAAASHVPFGTLVQIPGYGAGVVLDRGGAIVGNRLDVFFHDCRDAWQWGRRTVLVTWVGAISPTAEYRVLLSEHDYWDTDAMVREQVWETPRGVVMTWEVLG